MLFQFFFEIFIVDVAFHAQHSSLLVDCAIRANLQVKSTMHSGDGNGSHIHDETNFDFDGGIPVDPLGGCLKDEIGVLALQIGRHGEEFGQPKMMAPLTGCSEREDGWLFLCRNAML